MITLFYVSQVSCVGIIKKTSLVPNTTLNRAGSRVHEKASLLSHQIHSFLKNGVLDQESSYFDHFKQMHLEEIRVTFYR